MRTPRAVAEFVQQIRERLSLAACLVCDTLWFCLGRRLGGSVLKYVCRVSIEPDTCVSKTHSAYLHYGAESLLVSKFLPWFGTLGPHLPGMFNLAIWKFLFLDAGGALLWAGRISDAAGYSAGNWAMLQPLCPDLEPRLGSRWAPAW